MSQLLRAPLALAPRLLVPRLLVPRLYSLDFRRRAFLEVPAVDLVAWPDPLLLLDSGSSSIIWIGWGPTPAC
jgi:hypothetical protein